jgi:phospholipid/cholesterol/gamma-HCH transport system permease protein
MIAAMTADEATERPLPAAPGPPARGAALPQRAWRGLRGWLRGWWQVVWTGALLLALALSPAGYAARHRGAQARQIVAAAGQTLPWFTLLALLASVVLTHIVIVTAESYGLTRYAIEMVVRVLVLELIPLAAALAVALRYSLPASAEVAGLRRRAGWSSAALRTPERLCALLLPRLLASVVAVPLLAAVSGVLALAVAYLSLHGLTLWAMAGFTRIVGQIFDPATLLVFGLKTLAFSLVVAVVPLASALHDAPGASRTRAGLRALSRLFVLLLLVEVVALAAQYA